MHNPDVPRASGARISARDCDDPAGILSLLAVAGMSMSTAEMAMAGNEQFRRLASDAASAGIETADCPPAHGAGCR